MGIPQMNGLYNGQFHLEMDDKWGYPGYPYFRKPPKWSCRRRALESPTLTLERFIPQPEQAAGRRGVTRRVVAEATKDAAAKRKAAVKRDEAG